MQAPKKCAIKLEKKKKIVGCLVLTGAIREMAGWISVNFRLLCLYILKICTNILYNSSNRQIGAEKDDSSGMDAQMSAIELTMSGG